MSATPVDAKLTVLVTRATKRRLEAEARATRSTVGALVRSKLGDTRDREEQMIREALADLERRIEALSARSEARRVALEREVGLWPQREAEIHAAVAAQITGAEREALADAFGLAKPRESRA